MRNYLGQSLALAALVVAFLALISIFSEEMRIGNYTLRKMDIFSAIRAQPAALLPPETVPLVGVDTLPQYSSDTIHTPAQVIMMDSTKFGVTFEDYTTTQSGLNAFFSAVDSIKYGRIVRVALLGDSFIEGDILAGDLRDSLQSVWGGAGVGFVPITSEVARYKRTLQHTYRGWNTHSIVKKSGVHPPFGLNGFVYVPTTDAQVQYEGADYFRHTRTWRTTRLFYHSLKPLAFTWNINSLAPLTGELQASDAPVQAWEWVSGQPDVRRFQAQIPADDSLWVYGCSLESGAGIYFDNFSVRGNTGGKLRQLQPAIMRRFDALLHYDLIVVQLGMNAVTRTLDNVKWYRHELDETFDHLRQCFPKQPILVIGVPDRADNFDGQLMTMPSVPAITAMQRQLAHAHGFLFFDLYHWMGGAGTMVRFAEQHPAWANRDYTHLTHAGGKVIGNRLAQVFIERYLTFKQLN